MMLEERLGKRVLSSFGLPVPPSRLVTTAEEAQSAAETIGLPVMLKAQVPAGGRGKAGGVQRASSLQEAREAAEQLLGSVLGGYVVERVLVEMCVAHDQEYYAAVLDDPLGRSPIVLCSAYGGTEIEEAEREHPGSVQRLAVALTAGVERDELEALATKAGIACAHVSSVAAAMSGLWDCYRSTEAELVEVNPLVVDRAGVLWALDAKVALDESALGRHKELEELVSTAVTPLPSTALEARAREAGLLFIELDGDVGIVANGAGLTMATLDVVTHVGGRPANFMEVGGDNYTRAAAGVELVLSNPKVRSLLVNFCGAFARTDVMTDGVLRALDAREVTVPVFFSIHGTGAQEAVALVENRLGVSPYQTMDDAVRAAVQAAKDGRS